MYSQLTYTTPFQYALDPLLIPKARISHVYTYSIKQIKMSTIIISDSSL